MAPWPSISPSPSNVKWSTPKKVRRLASFSVQMLFGATMLPSSCRSQVQMPCFVCASTSTLGTDSKWQGLVTFTVIGDLQGPWNETWLSKNVLPPGMAMTGSPPSLQAACHAAKNAFLTVTVTGTQAMRMQSPESRTHGVVLLLPAHRLSGRPRPHGSRGRCRPVAGLLLTKWPAQKAAARHVSSQPFPK